MSQELAFANRKAGTVALEAVSAGFLDFPNSFPSNTSGDFRNSLQAISTISKTGNGLA